MQPNVSPLADYSEKNLPDIFGKQLALTDKAVRKAGAPDLILWNEVAVPYILSEDLAANKYLAKQIKKWNAPVLTGLIETKNYAENESRPPLLVAQNRDQEFFNAAALFQPAQIRMYVSHKYTTSPRSVSRIQGVLFCASRRILPLTLVKAYGVYEVYDSPLPGLWS